jgi:hypothetical protein
MRFVFFLVLFSFSAAGYPQTDSSSVDDAQEDLLENAAAEREIFEYYDYLEYLQQHRIMINDATVIELMKIPYLDRQTAGAIVRHRNMTGGISSADELMKVDGVNEELIAKILPFINFGPNAERSFFETITGNLKELDVSFRTRGINDLRKERAFETGKYEGSQLKFYNRLIISRSNKIRFGLLTEKDPGERSVNDFTTFHLCLSNIGIIKNITLGDYLFEFGQGLALWSRYSISKGTETVGILPRGGKGIIPYLSSDENMFFRGGAVQLSLYGLNFYAFASDKKLDGSVDPLTNEITSIRLDGFHRNPDELNHRKIIGEKNFGFSADFTLGETASLGILYYSSEYSSSFRKESQSDPSGRSFHFFSAGYNIALKRISLSGELSYNSKAAASINNAEIYAGNRLSLLFSFRYYPGKYWGLHTNGFGERNGTQNETGFYTGLKLRTDFGIFSFYYDQFKFPFTGERLPFSSGGYEFLIYYTVKPIRNSEIRFRYSLKKIDEVTIIDNTYGTGKKGTKNLRLELSSRISEIISLKARLNLVYIANPPGRQQEKGFLLFEEIKYSPYPAFSISARIIFFRTDSYDSRLYEFENDLPGVMTNSPLYGEGSRWYLVAKYKTGIGVTFSLKYSELFKPGEKSLGSGDTEIKGNIDNRLGFQADFQL